MILTSIVLRDERDEPVGHVRNSQWSGWLWACALCPAANPPGAGSDNSDTAVRRAIEHVTRYHVTPSPAVAP